MEKTDHEAKLPDFVDDDTAELLVAGVERFAWTFLQAEGIADPTRAQVLAAMCSVRTGYNYEGKGQKMIFAVDKENYRALLAWLQRKKGGARE